MAKWADGLKSKLSSVFKESTTKTESGLYKKTEKVNSFDTSNLSAEEKAELERLKQKSENKKGGYTSVLKG